ncbi:MAG: glutamine synthetase III [Christensenellales bacterium]
MRITESKKITDFFGCNVFDDATMKKYLSESAYKELREVIDQGKQLGKELANEVAAAMKEWASQNGATHYTHWFQPLTGTTAEKHDSFIALDKNGNTVLEFTGSNLRKGEADASSFPSGGIRATFEARGYTIWDCSSPAFIKRSKNGTGVLYIPTAFCSYTGDALDKKTPLLKSMEAINKQGLRLLKILGVQAGKVIVNVGGEQEYFLIDKKDFNKRDDLRFTGRTLFGALPPKGQEKNDQYYASIRDRVSDFMADVDEELWKLGITAKTEHNEAAPAQHELAPIFSVANVATDQNQLIMETLKKVAENHNLACLLHEKPFANINGSGKHCNWSLSTDDGVNLLKPGSDPSHNRTFLLFFTAVIAAVDKYADLIRMSAASLGNEARLGGNEAPPAIISVYTGEDMEKMFDAICAGEEVGVRVKEYIKSGVNYLAELGKDTSDRNRTAPFAFTGNKFEFRMVGSSATLSTPCVILNTTTADVLSDICDRLEKVKPNQLDRAIVDLVKELYTKHRRVVFNGNGYSKEWGKEARRRGLEVLENSVDAYETFTRDKNVELFEKHKVMTRREIESRQAIYLDNYIKSAGIEAETLIMMVKQNILPATMKYQSILASQINALNLVAPNLADVQNKHLLNVSELLNMLDNRIEKLKFAKNTAGQSKDVNKQAILVRDQVLTLMDSIREVIDKLEGMMPKEIWPYPTYSDILFYN